MSATATCSRTTGWCIFGSTDDQIIVVNAMTGLELPADSARFALGCITDWDVASGSTREEVLSRVATAGALHRVLTLLEEALLGLSESLLDEVLEHVEELLQTRTSSQLVLNKLLRAPLDDASEAERLVTKALGLGLAGTAAILQQLAELQPLLRRLVDGYLGAVPADLDLGEFDRASAWRVVVDAGLVKSLLESRDRSEFLQVWADVASSESAAARRKELFRWATYLADLLYPSARSVGKSLVADVHEEDEDDHTIEVRPHGRNGARRRERVLRQIKAIADAVAEGRDERARHFLDDLIREQTRTSTDMPHAIKSLCNIAKQCADMFRADFERICLEAALELDPLDSWTLAQWGDHLKRTGQFAEALKALEKAALHGDPKIALTTAADVLAVQGEHAEAIRRYREVPGWEDDEQIRTAIADNYRRMGNLEAARRAYEEITHSGMANSRVVAGVADIYRRLGRVGDAAAIYEHLLTTDLRDRDLREIRLAAARLYKQMRRYEDALALIHEVIQKYPFMIQARLLRASTLALQNSSRDLLAGLPPSARVGAFGEWVQQYYYGLLLLKLGRYQEAERHLQENAETAFASQEERALLRVAAALSFVGRGEIVGARRILNDGLDIPDAFTRHVVAVLDFCIAVHERDERRQRQLVKSVVDAMRADPDLRSAVDAIRSGDSAMSYQYQLAALLRIAA